VCLSLPSARAAFEAQLKSRDGILNDRDFAITKECETVLVEHCSALAANDKLIAAMCSSLRFLDSQYGLLRHRTTYFIAIPVLIAVDSEYDQGISDRIRWF
jgi:hypothetical protein